MLDTAVITAFVATTHPDRAREFYTGTLGLRLVTEDDFAIALDANGIEIRIQKVGELAPHPFTSLGWQVKDIVDTVRSLVARGVTFQRYPFLQLDELGIWSAPSGTRVAWFKDPDSNLLSVSQAPRR